MSAGRSLRRLILFLAGWLALAAPAAAAVEIAFYSREMGGSNFPHAFVRLSGTLDSTGERIDTTYGFTARRISPAILLGSVPGEVVVEEPQRIAVSQRQFALTLGDAGYRDVVAVVERWRSRRQPSYNLNRRNCVHFVEELARAAGLRTDGTGRLMRRPRTFLEHLRNLNAGLINPR